MGEGPEEENRGRQDGRVELTEITAALRALMPDVLVATDFDGTLRRSSATRRQSQPVDGAIDVLADLARPVRRSP